MNDIVTESSRLEITEDGWLEGPGVTRMPSVRHSPLTSKTPDGDPGPLGVVWHWTGGVCHPGYASTLAHRIQSLAPHDRRASWHAVISKQGAVHQSVSFEQGSWHCAEGLISDPHRRKHRVNRSTGGIELENAGRLKQLGGRWHCHPYWKKDVDDEFILVDGHRVPDPELVVDTSRAAVVHGEGVFDEFPNAQCVAAHRVLLALMGRYGLDAAHCRYQHGDFDPQRREDAGPLWRRVLASWFPAPPAPLTFVVAHR